VIETADEFARLRRSDDPAEQRRATTDEAPVYVWLDVIERYPDLRRWVARNKTTPAEMLDRLARDPDPQVRWDVAITNRTPPTTLTLLAGDDDESVRARVARHRHTPDDVVERLRCDRSAIVRRAAEERDLDP
jgi:hypothetical protein